MSKLQEIQNKYWAYEILSASKGIAEIAGSISSSKIDLNPHQIEAALFALHSPISKGVILADEVGLGKTIEAGLVLSEFYLKEKQRLMIVCPASLRKQWEKELEDKFDIPTRLLDRSVCNDFLEQGKNPLEFKGCLIVSYHFATDYKKEIQQQGFDLVVIDEAHKLRNLYKGKTKIADSLYTAFFDTKKLLLTATPIQNSLMDIYSLVTFIDHTILGNEYAFIENYLYSQQRHQDLKKRLEVVLHRTLRKDVLEYIRYTERKAMTVAFNPTKEELDLYDLISDYIGQQSTYGIQTNFRALIVLMIRKLMASSTSAVKGTLERIKERLEQEKKRSVYAMNLSSFIGDNDFTCEYREEFELIPELKNIKIEQSDIAELEAELKCLEKLIRLAEAIKVDGKTNKLITALENGFEKIKENGGSRKAIIFTESQRTLEYLFKYLSKNGFKNKIVTFSGSNNSPLCKKIYEEYKTNNPLTLSGVKSADMRQALLEKFKNDAEIMIATEAGAEGLNLQFCSLLVNYDLPWNPQRVEQRIGRVHRYGQKHDVVIINFINKSNLADVRLYQILQDKFKLFDGVFGASDEILGSLEDGLDFEKAVADIFETCRTPKEIETAFDKLQAKLGEEKEKVLNETKQLVLEYMTPTTAERLRIIKNNVDSFLERQKDIFWRLTKNLLEKKMFVNEETKTFGEFKEQVFNLPTERKLAVNFCFRLDFTKKDKSLIVLPEEKKKERLMPTAYNPTTEYGKIILEKALLQESEPAHLLSTVKGIRGNGVLKLSLYKRTHPDNVCFLIATFLDKAGGEVKLNVSEFFDNIFETEEIRPLTFEKMLDYCHDKKIKSIASKDKRSVEETLKTEIEKLNRWAYEEKNSLKYQIKALENKLVAIKRKFKAENNLAEKIKIGIEIEAIENKIADLQLNNFEKQGSIEKQATALIAGRKRVLKYKAEVLDIMTCTWECG